MPKSTKPSFVTELPLKVDSAQDRELSARFQAARQLYNGCLGEAMTRVKLLRKSEAYQKARKISKNLKKQRAEAFSAASASQRYSEYDLHSFASVMAKSSGWIADKIDSNTQQTIATRAIIGKSTGAVRQSQKSPL